MPHIEVNEENIDRFDLVRFTENSRETLLNEAANAAAKGMVLSVHVPDDLVALNIFDTAQKVEHEDPSPIADALVPNNRCRYETSQTPFGKVEICIIHNEQSKHDTLVDPQAPCLHVDRY